MNHLYEKEASDVIKMLTDLFAFAYQKKHPSKDVNMFEIQGMLLKGSEILFENEQTSNELISEYIAMHKLGNRKKRTIERWKGCKKRNLIYIEEDDSLAYLMDKKEQKVYGVKGISDPLSISLDETTIPAIVNYTILPYQDGYIVDTIGMVSNIIELEEWVEIYNMFREINLRQPVEVSLNRTEMMEHRELTPDADVNVVFEEFMQPLMFFIKKMPESSKEVISYGIFAWNIGVTGDHSMLLKNDYEKIFPMIKRKKETFAQYQYEIVGGRANANQFGFTELDLQVSNP